MNKEIEYIKARIQSYKGGYMPISYSEEILNKLDEVQAKLNVPTGDEIVKELNELCSNWIYDKGSHWMGKTHRGFRTTTCDHLSDEQFQSGDCNYIIISQNKETKGLYMDFGIWTDFDLPLELAHKITSFFMSLEEK